MEPSQANLRSLTLVRRVIYLLVAAVVALPFFLRLPLPFTPSPRAKDLYDRVDKLNPGDHVLLSFDFDPASEAELYPMTQSLLQHCFKKGVIPVVMTHWSTGLDMDKKACEQAARAAEDKWGKQIKSGRDYVFLGYRPGMSNLVLKMGENLKGAFEKDFFDQPTRTMPALQGVNSLRDFDLAIDLAAGATVEMWIAYGSDRFGLPLGVGTTAVQAPDLYPFLQSGQLVGLLGGLRGAADYESMLDVPGRATRGMQAQSAAHMLLVALLIGANARILGGWLARKWKDFSHE